MPVEQSAGFKGQGPTAGDKISVVNIPDGLQGIRAGQAADDVYCPLDVNGSTVQTGDISRTRLTGGLGHYIVHSKTPSSGHSFRDDQGKSGRSGTGLGTKWS